MSRLGFDPVRLRFALHTALAACLALLVSWLLGLEHPQWSAMTVWAASQPTRGMLLEKSFFRAAGTVVGTLVGVLLVLVSGGQPVVLVPGLALWIGLAAGAGNVLRGFASYGTLLAGYSAAMVALLATPHPDRILALGTDRLLTVMAGVLVALLVGLLFTPSAAEDEIAGRVRRLSGRLLRDMAARLAGAADGGQEEQHAILSEMAAIEEALDPHGAGSLRSRRSARTLRAVLIAHVSALLWLRSADARTPHPAVGAALSRVAQALADAAPAAEVIAALRQAAALSAGHAALNEVIVRLQTPLRDQLGVAGPGTERARAPRIVPLHRDWIGARHALIRATGTMLLGGAGWLLTGWSGGAYTLLGTAIMISLFSTFDNPAAVMRDILLGQVFGAAAALVCRWLVWPLAGSGVGLVVLTMPFILLGAGPVAHRRTMQGGYDYNLVMLLLLQPAYPLVGTVGASVSVALAVVAAPLVALIAFRVAYPADARRRMDTLITMMVHELQDMAAAADAALPRPIWRARLHHRLLRLVRWADKAGEREISAFDGSLAILRLGNAILGGRDLLRGPHLSAGAARCVDTALRRVRRIRQDPERAQRALQRAAWRLSREAPAVAALIGDAAQGIAANPGFFRRAAGRSLRPAFAAVPGRRPAGRP